MKLTMNKISVKSAKRKTKQSAGKNALMLGERQKQLVTLLKEAGADLVGMGHVGGYLPDSLSDLETAISVAVHLSDRIIDEITVDKGPTQTYFHHYRTMNTFLDTIGLKAALQIQRWGFAAMPVPASQSLMDKDVFFSGRFQHRLAATRAGLGWIGKNSCLVTDQYGPRIRLVTILTNMPLISGEPVTQGLCGACRICIDACPAGALIGETEWSPVVDREKLIDPSLCSHYMKKAYQHIGRGAVCGICFRICPKGMK